MDNKQWSLVVQSNVTLVDVQCSCLPQNTYYSINGFLLWMIKYPFRKLNLDFPFIILEVELPSHAYF
mgnify:CR=1 FL=1